MSTPVSIIPEPDGNGGITLWVKSAQVALRLPMGRSTACEVAASILRATGITEATFSDGTLYA